MRTALPPRPRTPVAVTALALLAACAMTPSPCTHAACAPLPGRFVDAGDARVWTIELGAGAAEIPPLVFVHGVPTTSYLWRNVQRVLAPHHRTLAIDLPPLGASDDADGDWRLERQAERVAAWADALGIERFVLVAHDVGGGVAHHFAARFPQRVAKLVLVDVVAFADTWPVAPVQLLRVPVLGQLASVLGPHASLFAQQVRRGFAAAERLERCTLWRWYEPYAAIAARLRFVSFVRALDPRAVEAALRAYAPEAPRALVVWGARDRFQPVEAGRRLHALLRDASWLELADAGHFLPEERPEALAAAIDAFVSGGDPVAAVAAAPTMVR
jgi:pimeloyl-ACP methyl ester carboxylesterase